MKDSSVSLDKLFYPENVAVVGASGSFAKPGTVILFSVLAGGFKGGIYPINPKENEILGLKAYSSLKIVPVKVDLAIICVQAKLVPRVLKECNEADINLCIIISSGFAEVGEEGKELEKEIYEIARTNGIRIIGPNCMGLASSDNNLFPLMNMLIPSSGSVSVISQSGTIGSLTAMYGSEQGVGFNKYISSGNEMDLHTEDFIEYLTDDSQTKVISVFVEGIKDGMRFIEVARKASVKKPLIILKGGVTKEGAKAAASHTGSITGSNAVYDAVVKQSGIIKAEDERDMIDLIKAFSLLPLPKGRNIGVTGAWGGYGVLVSDACGKEGLTLPELTQTSMNELNQLLPPFWSQGNPIDITGSGLSMFGGDSSMLIKPIEILMRDSNIDSVICMLLEMGPFLDKIKPRMHSNYSEFFSTSALESMTLQGIETAKDVIFLKNKYNKPLIVLLIGFYEGKNSKFIGLLEDNGIPVYDSSHRAARVLNKLVCYREFIDKSIAL